MKKTSAGLLVYRVKNGQAQVLVGHMGGPWFAKKDKGAWSIPKGEYEEGEEPLEVAKREFKEELSKPAPEGEFKELGTIEQKNKTVIAWAIEADLDVGDTRSNTFTIEWPPKSGTMQEFPEIDRVEWASLERAPEKLIQGQSELIERLASMLDIKLEKDEMPEQSSLF